MKRLFAAAESHTSMAISQRFHGLDTLRALAILMVVLYHLSLQDMVPSLLTPLARIGWAGVDLFFVLSGFLIGSQLMKPYLDGSRPSLRDFYTRRLYRILPAFLVVLLLYLVVPLWREAPGPYAVWQYLTFTWNLLLLGYPGHRAFSHIWSLCVEEHFYLLFPPLLLLLMRKPSTGKTASVLLSLTLGGIALRGALLHFIIQPSDDHQGLLMMERIYYPTYARLDGLVTGVTLALLRTFKHHWWSRLARHGDTLAFLGIALVLAGLQLCGFNYPDPALPLSIILAFPILAIGFGLLVAAALCDRGLLQTRLPGASLLATLAYSLYLTHKSVAHATHQLLPHLTAQPGWPSFTIYLLSCLTTACLLYLGVERPCLALRTRHRSQMTPAKVSTELSQDPAI